MSSILSGLGVIDARRKHAAAPEETSVGYASAQTEGSALRPFRPDGRVLKSELPGVSNEAWTDFVLAMRVGPLGGVSESNGVGMFDLRFKRLAELGLVANVRYKRDPVTNRSVQVADWVAPLTAEKFLRSASVQYKVFVASVQAHVREIREGRIALPSGVTTSGALAILNRGGRGALAKWAEQQFEQTRELFQRVNGVF